MFNQIYYLGLGPISYIFVPWTEDIGLCGTFTYTSTITPPTSTIIFNPSEYRFTVNTNDPVDVALY